MIPRDDASPDGLPWALPPGEKVLWSGQPSRAALARGAFHVRGVAVYFGLLTAVAAGFAWSSGTTTGLIATASCGVAALVVLQLLAIVSTRAAIYTLTDRRIVLRVGVALPKYVNLPLARVAEAGLHLNADGSGDIPLTLTGASPMGWLALWPHARPWRLARPEPMLRAVPDAGRVAALLARACLAANPDGHLSAPVAVDTQEFSGKLAAA